MSCYRTEGALLFSVSRVCSILRNKPNVVVRECQVNDWKNGRPRPHKQICGKPLTEDDFQTTGTTDTDTSNLAPWLPPADPTFKRSPALLLQLHRLTEQKDVDYVVRCPLLCCKDWGVHVDAQIASPYDSGNPDYGIHIPEDTGMTSCLFFARCCSTYLLKSVSFSSYIVTEVSHHLVT